MDVLRVISITKILDTILPIVLLTNIMMALWTVVLTIPWIVLLTICLTSLHEVTRTTILSIVVLGDWTMGKWV